MTSKEALEKIKQHPAWNYAAIHGMNKVDDGLVEAFNIIEEELEGAEKNEYYWQENVNQLQNRLQENKKDLDLLELILKYIKIESKKLSEDYYSLSINIKNEEHRVCDWDLINVEDGKKFKELLNDK